MPKKTTKQKVKSNISSKKTVKKAASKPKKRVSVKKAPVAPAPKVTNGCPVCREERPRKSPFLAVVSIIAMILFVWFVFGYTTTDADGDGYFESGEEVTFIGDKQDPDGFDYDTWEWDFDNDGTWDATGMVTTNIFDAAGNYNVVLREGSSEFDIYEEHAQVIDIVVEVSEEEDPVEEPVEEEEEERKITGIDRARSRVILKKAVAYGVLRCKAGKSCIKIKKAYGIEKIAKIQKKIRRITKLRWFRSKK